MYTNLIPFRVCHWVAQYIISHVLYSPGGHTGMERVFTFARLGEADYGVSRNVTLYKFNLLLRPLLHHEIFVLKAAQSLVKTEAANMTENPIYWMN